MEPQDGGRKSDQGLTHRSPKIWSELASQGSEVDDTRRFTTQRSPHFRLPARPGARFMVLTGVLALVLLRVCSQLSIHLPLDEVRASGHEAAAEQHSDSGARSANLSKAKHSPLACVIRARGHRDKQSADGELRRVEQEFEEPLPLWSGRAGVEARVASFSVEAGICERLEQCVWRFG